jgi:DNA-directed RNA polymerase subunit RPC12/RpoP
MAMATTPARPTRCTDCGRPVADPERELTWFPFVVYACTECAAKRRAKAEAQRRMGDVCHRCRKPFSLCVC